jgi:hypothetical protein
MLNDRLAWEKSIGLIEFLHVMALPNRSVSA